MVAIVLKELDGNPSSADDAGTTSDRSPDAARTSWDSTRRGGRCSGSSWSLRWWNRGGGDGVGITHRRTTIVSHTTSATRT